MNITVVNDPITKPSNDFRRTGCKSAPAQPEEASAANRPPGYHAIEKKISGPYTGVQPTS